MTENRLGVQTRSMADAQYNKEEIADQPEHQPVQMNTNNPTAATDHPTPNLDQWNAALNLTVELMRMEANNMEEYIRRFSDIGLDWYVPNLSNTRMRDMIRDRLPISTGRSKNPS